MLDSNSAGIFFSRVLRDSISHCLVGPSVGHKVVLNAFFCIFTLFNTREGTGTLFENANARDLGLMTLFILNELFEGARSNFI